MENNHVVLACDENENFFVLWKCVNQVTSFTTTYNNKSLVKENIASIHLRNHGSGFEENMCRRIQPLYDKSSYISFPTTSSNNITTFGRNSDLPYFNSVQSLYRALAFDKFEHVEFPPVINNRNYTMLVHGIENRSECLSYLEENDSVHYTRNDAFPPLKSLSRYNKKDRHVLCQNQIYENSFAVNTQRQTDSSLVTTSPTFLSSLLQHAIVDVSLNHLCVEWELKLKRNLSMQEKIQLLIEHEYLRGTCNEENFQTMCGSIQLVEYDDAYRKNIFGIRRKSRQNPEMIDIFKFLPNFMKDIVVQRWEKENKLKCFKDSLQTENKSYVNCKDIRSIVQHVVNIYENLY